MKLLSLLLALLPAFAYCQKSEIIQDSAETKAAIFSKSMAWVANKWNSANNVVQMKDADAGMIIVKGAINAVPKTMGIAADGQTMTTVTIHIKDGKAKIDFDETFFKWGTGQLWKPTDDRSNGQFKKWRDEVNKEIDGLIADYKKSLSKSDNF